MSNVAVYIAIAVPFLVIELVWLRLAGPRLYRPVLGDILAPEPRLGPAALFYLVYPLGLMGFAVMPAHQDGNQAQALVSGMMFGFFTYATYDLTNQATLRNWTTTLTAIDVVWGAILATFCSYCGYLAAARLL